MAMTKSMRVRIAMGGIAGALGGAFIGFSSGFVLAPPPSPAAIVIMMPAVVAAVGAAGGGVAGAGVAALWQRMLGEADGLDDTGEQEAPPSAGTE
ncbi:hypothetical protein ACIGBH_11990 [Streptomyces sp. NPDC085929]|uniref:hypothetical protein n=1 Tax=Streptomyces sp. NPDC085929 TaxID=3365739 RepID=UPI0037CFADA0